MDEQSIQNDQPAPQPVTDEPRTDQAANNATQSLRTKALNELVPLVDQLDASPQRKFEMFITAARISDDQSLLEKAFEAARKIENPSEKADALLDILNEASLTEES